jgi:GT2 family glycosyltransferase
MISIVIVNWNSGRFLERCVNSLLQHASGCEVIVVDNASEDESLDFLALRRDMVLIRNCHNAGFAAASNTGWRRGKGDPVLFLNPDVEALPGAVARLAESLEHAPSVWAAGGRLVGDRRQGNLDPRRFPSVASVAADMLFLDEAWPGNPWTAQYHLAQAGNSVFEVDQPAAACLMMRRSALESTGGYDESFAPAWFEDVDLCKRIHDRGGRIVFEPAARFLHHGGFSVERLGYADFFKHYGKNRIRYFAKHHGHQAAGRVRIMIGVGMFLRSVVSMVVPLAGRSSRLRSARTFWRAGCYFIFGRDIFL